jgi:hypothetical protein
MLSELCDDLDSYIGTFCVHIQNDKIHSFSNSIFLDNGCISSLVNK